MNKKLLSAIAMICLAVMLFSFGVEASKPYQTYTYSIDGMPLHSPDAYTPIETIDSNTIDPGLKNIKNVIDDPRDLVVDDQLNVYIVDAGSNRVIVLDRYYKYKFIISTFVNDHGVPDELTSPSGVYVTEDRDLTDDVDDGRIYVCDTDSNRIVTFDKNGNFVSIIPEPEDEIFGENASYKPIAMAVDNYDRLFVVSRDTHQGVIVMTAEGDFIGLIGAQAVTTTTWDIIWRMFMTKEQRAQQAQNLSFPFNNITINDEGFVYVTTSAISDAKVRSFITSKSTAGTYSPVKMLNAEGDEIMRRNGFYPPAGEIQFATGGTASIVGPSTLIDVALGPENTWSVIDEKRCKIFTYDFDGNLLFAFGNMGQMLGNLTSIKSIAYQGDRMLILDNTNDNITVYDRTEYGDIIIQALANQNNRKYDKAVEDWTEILKRNSNFDAAYIGIGQSLYRSGKYEESLSYYRSAYDTANYSDSYKEIRKEWISNYILVLVLVVAAIIVGWVLLVKYANKVNTRAAVSGGKRTLKEELLYGFHLSLHPFDGFWDLKHEKRGSLRGAIIYIVITILAFFYQAIGQGYVLSPEGTYATLWGQASAVLVPLFLFIVANWCLTTLFEGEGSFKDIFIATSYSLFPIPFFVIPTTIVSNWALVSEVKLLNFLVTVSFIWMGMLIFFGTMVTHDYSFFKNIITLGGTLVGMVFIMFLCILFTTLLGKLVGLVTNIITEINYRL